MQCLMNIPYVDLAQQHVPIKEELIEAVGRVMDSGKFILSEQVREFENRFSELCGARYALGVKSGTDALILALRSLDIGEGDEVITAANSFITTASSIVLVGAKPILVDVRDDFTIDPDLIEKKITKKTKALLPVHLTGKPADMDAIDKIARQYKLKVIDDCAQAVCAAYKGRMIGSLGDVSCFSLHPLKTLNACGDGGVITTDNEDVYNKLVMLRNNGFVDRSECRFWSNNSRLDEFQAAMLLVKLKYVNEWTEQRILNARYYDKYLKDVEQVLTPISKTDERSVYHTYVIQADNRDELSQYLKERGIRTKVHYPIPIHLQMCAKDLGYKEGDFPRTEAQAGKILSLPVYAGLEQDQLQYIVESIIEFYPPSQKTPGLARR